MLVLGLGRITGEMVGYIFNDVKSSQHLGHGVIDLVGTGRSVSGRIKRRPQGKEQRGQNEQAVRK